MKYKIINEDHLVDSDIEETIIRVKAFLMNDKKEILLASSNGGVQLVGGHVEKNETPMDALLREIKEEVGIELEKEEISGPFFEVQQYIKNYPKTSKNRLSRIIYYVIRTNKTPNLENLNLTPQEKENHFQTVFVPYDSFEKYVKGYVDSEVEANQKIAQEIIVAFKELHI